MAEGEGSSRGNREQTGDGGGSDLRLAAAAAV